MSPNGQVYASSYPQRYPIGQYVSDLLPSRLTSIHDALTGVPGNDTITTPAGKVLYAVEPIWSNNHTPIGALYVQVPFTTIQGWTVYAPSLATPDRKSTRLNSSNVDSSYA